MKPLPIFIAVALLLLAGHSKAAFGPPVTDEEVTVRIVSTHGEVAPGQPFHLGIVFDISPGWHIYWKNSGDTGLPPEIKWTLPEDTLIGDIQWPVPNLYQNAGLTDHIYEGKVVLFQEVTLPESVQIGSNLKITATVDWLMCEDICIPGRAKLALELPVRSEYLQSTEGAALLSSSAKTWPTVTTIASGAARISGKNLQLPLTGISLPSGRDSIHFFDHAGIVEPGAPQTWIETEDELLLQLTLAAHLSGPTEKITGVLRTGPGEGWLIDLPIDPSLPLLRDSAAPTYEVSWFALLALAFLGGIILNVMPCVFPVLGIKVMNFVQQSGENKKKVLGHSLMFTLGILVSFWALAGVLIALRAGGAEIGWGFQLQSSAFVFSITIFLFLFALFLSGVFEMGYGLASLGGKHDRHHGLGGSFLSGVLATIVATPCSAPILGTALAGALALPAGASLLAFSFIGLGLATPYVVLSLYPPLIRKLPKPGPWMESFKQFMAFPLYATAGWLVYILAGQLEADQLLNSIMALSGIAMAAWIYGRWGSISRPVRPRRTAQAIALIILSGSIYAGWPIKSELTWEAWSPQRVIELQEEGRPIYVDFTARWCATCQINKRVVFGSSEVVRFFLRENVALLKADWTNHDPEITRALDALGKAAVPVNLVFRPTSSEPIILPETLTPGIVLEAFKRP